MKKQESAYMVIGSKYDPEKDCATMESEKSILHLYTVNTIDQAIEKAKKMVEEGFHSLTLCGGFREQGAQKIVDATDGKLAVSYIVHLPCQDELFRSLFQNKELSSEKPRAGYMVITSKFDPEKDHAYIDHPEKGETHLFAVKSKEQSIEVAKQMLQNGFYSLELCGGFREQGAQAIIDATDGKLAVGYAVHLPCQDELFASLFQK